MVLFAVCVFTCSLHTDGREYIDNYPVFFSPYDLNITEKTGEIYDKINIGDTVEQAEEIMGRYVMQSIETHRGFLNELSRKQFDNQLARMDFHEDYTIYFTSFVHIKGNGFAGIKSENGIVTGVAVGNIDEHMFNEKSQTFGYSDSGTWKIWDDLNIAKEFVSGLKPGDKEENIIPCFGDDSGLLGEDIGLVYSQRKYLEDGAYKTYYRVYFCGSTGRISEEYEEYYLELYFTEGILQKGAFYTKVYTDTEMIPKKIMTIG